METTKHLHATTTTKPLRYSFHLPLISPPPNQPETPNHRTTTASFATTRGECPSSS
ncbi:uncharacterized protein G2W53_018153 [Senna tora]|uniref:Uncharacterized protein n=1 Tax=Senna tora TaxID=362788 RepID=A0A834TSH5_9FABA|nr:uncharacterized protein G2W53_018153 [Senna tora]